MKKTISYLLLAFILFGLISCGDSFPSADYLVSQGLSAGGEMPAGKVYACADASDEMLTSMFGDTRLPAAIAEADSYAFFLSSGMTPAEIDVFICFDKDSADDLAMICFNRLQKIKAAWAETQYAALTESAKVTVLSSADARIIVLTVCENQDDVLSKIRKSV